MPREGKAHVLTEAEWKRLLKVAAADDRQGVRNVALLTISFGLGLQVMEISRLSIGDVQDTQGRLREVVISAPSDDQGRQAAPCLSDQPTGAGGGGSVLEGAG